MTGHPVGEFILPLLDDKASWDPWVGMMIEYKGFIGHFTFHEEESLFRGKVANVQDLVTFEGQSVEAIHKAFREAVDAYVAWGEKYGRNRLKSDDI